MEIVQGLGLKGFLRRGNLELKSAQRFLGLGSQGLDLETGLRLSCNATGVMRDWY